jgi:inner membrane transporter RhtA
VLVLPGPSSDYLGIACGLVAAGCWAAYIVLNRVAGARLPGLQAPAVASGLCALAYLPVLAVVAADGRLTPAALGWAVAAGVLASVVPYAADLTALRFVPATFFSVFMSVHPVMAALVGLALLGQHLAAHEWIGIAVVVLANAAAVLVSGRAGGSVRLAADGGAAGADEEVQVGAGVGLQDGVDVEPLPAAAWCREAREGRLVG